MTHFWPDYAALIAGLRHEACIWPNSPLEGLLKCAADALEAERKVRTEEYAIAKHLRAAFSEALKECADDLEAWVDGHYHMMLNYPSEKRRFDRDMGPVLRARALLAHPTTEPAKAEEP